MIYLQGTRQRVERIGFSPDGRKLLVPSRRGLQLWDAILDGQRATILSSLAGWTLQFSRDARLLGLDARGYRLLDLDTHAIEEHSLTGGVGPQFSASNSAFTPDERAIILACTISTYPSLASTVSRRPLGELSQVEWSVVGNHRISSRPFFLPDPERFAFFGVWSETGSRSTGGPVYVTHDARTGKVLSEVRPKSDLFRYPVQSFDRRWIAAERAARIGVFDSTDFSIPPIIIRNDNRREFTGLAFHPSGQFLAATSNDNTVKFYDTSTWQMIHAFDWDIGRLRSIAFSSDGMLAAAGGDSGKIVVWDVDL